MMMQNISDGDVTSFLRTALAICSEAGELVRQARRTKDIAVATKNGFELVTNVDRQVDRLFRDRITGAFPNHQILSEEGRSLPNPARAVCWIVDPLDGTANFASGLPHVAISAAISVEGVVQAGVVEAPFYGETFHAVRGQGAFRNGERIEVSAVTEPQEALIATGFPHDRQSLEALVDGLRPLLRHFGDIRRLAAPALDICWVADGRLAGFIDRLFLWDFAAAGLIAEEAGAMSHAFEIENASGQRDYLVAAPGIYRQLLAAKLNAR
jgi:myo-inositol-1(or 4)-monophosphatase